MKVYELTVLVHPDLEMSPEPALKKLETLISDNGGKVVKTTDDGKKHLAYEIKDNEYALYYFYDVELPPEAIAKISSALNIAEEFLRYLIVAKDGQREKMEARRREAREAAEAAEAAKGADEAPETEAEEAKEPEVEETKEAEKSEAVEEAEQSADKDNKEE